MDAEQSAQRPGQSSRQRTLSTLRPQMTSQSTYPSATREASYSLAGPREQRPRQPPRHGTYVQQGYRDLNPEYEKEVHDPVFSLGGNLPHTVRGFMRRKGSTGKQRPVGVEREQKGETEAAPQLQNTDEKANRTEGQARIGEQDHAQDQGQYFPPQSPGTPSGNVHVRNTQARDSNGQPLGTIGEDVTFSPSGNVSDDEKTLAPEQPVDDRPFNRWAGFRRKYQDPLGEWLGVSLCF